MAPREVECERCGAEARVKRVEGELDLGKGKAGVILVIDCPRCGERQQREKPNSTAA